MGSYKSKNFKVDVESLPETEPEPDYVIKTRSPKPERWSLNLLRGQREDELKGLAYAYARRKCKRTVLDFISCERDNGAFWTAFECQEQNSIMLSCFKHELNVEMDKLRRNMKLNKEWWWRILYDEDGEVGDQEAWVDEYWLVPKMRAQFERFQQQIGLKTPSETD